MKYKAYIAVDAEDEDSRTRTIIIEANNRNEAMDKAFEKIGSEEGIIDIEEVPVSNTPENRVLGKFRR